MRIGVIQASSQATKNKMLYNAVTKYAPKDSEVINFGCTLEDKENYSYIEISYQAGISLFILWIVWYASFPYVSSAYAL